MSDIIDVLKKDPISILDSSSDAQESLTLIKSLFDPITKGNSVLDEVYIDGLDASQVWPQVKIILESVTENLMFDAIPELKKKNGIKTLESDSEISDEDENEFQSAEEDQEEEGEENSEENREEEGSEEGEEDDEDEEGEEKKEEIDEEEESEGESEDQSNVKDVHGLNDGFFSIDDFNKQILAQENNIEGDDDDEIDYFGDIPDSEDEEILYHNDFFDKKSNSKSKMPSKPSKKSQKETNFQEDEEDNGLLNEDDYDDGMKSAMNDLYDDEELEVEAEDNERESEKNLSSFERQQLKIQREIQQLEKEAIAEKKWAMKGEVKAKDRPADALLNEDLEFERTAKPVPVITAEVTETIEDLIRRRIKEDNFDDLPRRIITDVTNFRPSSTFELSESKSEKSLAQLYEDDYKNEDKNEVSEELQKSYDEIKELYQNISHKLDSLSSAHFIPKPAQKAIDIKVSTPAISMEDAQPLASSTANTLAPQEVFKATRSGNDTEITLKSGEVVARDELSREDKQRLRKANKRKRARDFQEKKETNVKKSKKQDVIDTLSKAKNVTIIDSKGEKTDVTGALKKDKEKQGSSALKL